MNYHRCPIEPQCASAHEAVARNGMVLTGVVRGVTGGAMLCWLVVGRVLVRRCPAAWRMRPSRTEGEAGK